MTIYEGNNNDMVIAKQTAVDGDIFYLINGGDTPKKAYEFRNGNWFDNRIEARAFEQSMDNMTQLEKFSKLNANTLAGIGDSIMAYNGDIGENTSLNGPIDVGNAFMSHAFEFIAQEGVGGERSDQIANRFDEFLILGAKFNFVQAGTNDVAQEVPAKTSFGYIKGMHDKTLAAGSFAVVPTVPPFASYTGNQQSILLEVNGLIRKYAYETENVILVDYYKYLVDGDTGVAKTGYLVDTVHPNPKGAYVMGLAFKEALEPWVYPVNLAWDMTQSDMGNLLTNPALKGDTSGIADGWDVFGTNTPTKESASGYIDVDKQVFTLASGGAFTCRQIVANDGKWVNGDSLLATIRVEGVGVTNLERLYLELNFYDGSEFTTIQELNIGTDKIVSYDPEDFDITLKVPVITVPDDQISVYFSMRATAEGTFKLSEPTIYNLGQ